MDSQRIRDELEYLSELAERACREDSRCREAIRAVGSWLVSMVERLDAEQAELERIEAERESPRQPPEPEREMLLKLSGEQVSIRVPGGEVAGEAITGDGGADVAAATPEPAPAPQPLPSLAMVSRRARLKAEACRWAATRRRRLAEDADFRSTIAPTDKDLLDRARDLPDCYLWMLDPYGPTLPEDRELGEVEAAYANVSSAAELVQTFLRAEEDEPELDPPIEAAVAVLAEAQSALRVVLLNLGMTRPEADQADAFNWLRMFTFDRSIFVSRYMKRDDAADPAQWRDLQDRIDAIEGSFESIRQNRRQRRSLFNRARYHASRLDHESPDETFEDWRTFLQAVDDLVLEGVNPSDVDLRELLLPHAEFIPDSIEPGDHARLALSAVDRYLAGRERQEPAPAITDESHTRPIEVEKVATLLKGERVVLIGGVERPHARRALEQEFGLSELCWISTSPHMSLSAFEPEIARPETAVVMLAIRWCSHSFEGVRDLCKAYGKAYIRLPGGYGVNQVARQVLAQGSEQLSHP